MEEKKFCMKSRAELDEIRKQQASKKASVNEELTEKGKKIDDFNHWLVTSTTVSPDDFWDGSYDLDLTKKGFSFEQLDKMVVSADNFEDVFKQVGWEDKIVKKDVKSESRIRKANKKASVNEDFSSSAEDALRKLLEILKDMLLELQAEKEEIDAIPNEKKRDTHISRLDNIESILYALANGDTYVEEDSIPMLKQAANMHDMLIQYSQLVDNGTIKLPKRKAENVKKILTLLDTPYEVLNRIDKIVQLIDTVNSGYNFEYNPNLDMSVVQMESLMKEIKATINEISDETVYNSVARAHSVAKDGKTIQRAVRMHNKGLNREFAKNGLPNPKTLENPLTGDEYRVKEYARVNKEYSDKIASRMKSESFVNEVKIRKQPQGDLIFNLVNQVVPRKDGYGPKVHYDWDKKIYEIIDTDTDEIIVSGKPSEIIKWAVENGAKKPMKDLGFEIKGAETLDQVYRRNWNKAMQGMNRNESLTASKALAMSKAILENTVPYAKGTTPNDLSNIWVVRAWVDNMDSEDGYDNIEFTKIGLIDWLNSQEREYDEDDYAELPEDISDEDLIAEVEDYGFAYIGDDQKVIEIRPYSTVFSESKINEISDELANKVYNKRMKNLAKAQQEFNPETGEGFGDMIDAETKYRRNSDLWAKRQARKNR